MALAQGLGGSGTNSSGLYPVPYSSRVIGIFNDQLYGSAAVSVGVTAFVVSSTSAPATPGSSTARGSFSSRVHPRSMSPTLYGITAVSTGTNANALVALSDTLDGTSAPSFSTLATAPLNCVFRGVAPAPVPEGRDGVSRGDAECGMHRLKTCATRACCGTGYQPVLRDAEVAQVFNLCLIRRRLQTCVPSAAGTRAALPTARGSPGAGSVASFLRGSSGMPLGRRGPACSARAA